MHREDRTHTEDRARTRERRTAWFIAAVMVAAVLYFASQGGILQDLLREESPAPARFTDLSDISRRGVTLPLDFPLYDPARMERDANALRSHAVNWTVLRIPVWTPTPRNLEYSSFDLRRCADAVRLLKERGLGVSVAPVFWDGEALRSTPRIVPERAFFRGYRDMVLDMADLAASSGADALILDGLFGFRGISAASWLNLLEDVRTRFPRALEARADTHETPVLYLRHFDAAHLPPDTDRPAAVRAQDADVRLFLLQGSRDRYGAALEPWDPVLLEAGNAVQDADRIITDEENDDVTEGFTLSGTEAYLQLTREGSPLSRQMQLRRQRGQVRELNRRQQQLLPHDSAGNTR